MNRRKFLEITGLGIASSLHEPMFAAFGPSQSANGNTNKPVGSGHFGEWFTDQFGMAAYRYTCNQLTDPFAQTTTNKDSLASNDHLHPVGNDRLVAVASNFGYVRVRQDEGAPKYLNDYMPTQNRFGGGIGFLTDGEAVLSTYYPGNGESFERVWGQGYFQKVVRGNKYTIDQTIFAPFGGDPVLISLAKVTNRGSESAKLRWVEYWGCSNYQLSFLCTLKARVLKELPQVGALRRQLAAQFEHRFEPVANGRGLLEKQKFMGYTPEDAELWEKLKAANLASEPANGTAYDDLNPPHTFLVSLDGPMDGYATDAEAFFGSGGVLNPDGMKTKLGSDLSAKGSSSAYLVERDLVVEPNETKSIAFLYGYLPEGFELDTLMGRYAIHPHEMLKHSCGEWTKGGMRLSVTAEPWVEREISWHNYCLRSALTWDSFFREPIISQGCVYQYVMGFQGAARDPLQHALPFIFSNPEIVRGVIRYTLKETQPDGSIPYAIVGNGVPMPSEFLPSDQEMWVLWALSEYVLATRDKAFLNERVPLYPRHEVRSGDPTVGELAMRCYRHFVDAIGVGEHGLARLLMGDWNDAIVVSQVPDTLKAEVREKGETTLNAAMACYVLDHYSRLLSYLGAKEIAEEAHAKAEAQRVALRAQWAGRWYSRAWLGPNLGWLGKDHLWLEPQPWAMIGGAATEEQSKMLMQAIDELLRRPSPIGAMIKSKATESMRSAAGILENGGVWPSINGTLIWALAMKDGAMAWDEWKKNSLARHASTYPNIWYGIWSGPDTFNSVLSDRPGETQYADPNSKNPKERVDLGFNWTDCPVMCQHQHCWPLYSLAKLMGIEFHQSGINLAPVLPLTEYEFNTRLLGLKKSRSRYSGWYQPSTGGNWKIAIRLPDDERARVHAVKVNDVRLPVATGYGPVEFNGESQPGKPLRWELI